MGWGGPAPASLSKAFKYSKQPDRFLDVAEELYRSKYFFSTVSFIKNHLLGKKPLKRKHESIIFNLLLRTGITSFKDLPTQRYYNIIPKSPALSFILGRRLFRAQNHVDSIKALRRIRSSHPLAAENFFILGTIHGLRHLYSRANKYYRACQKYSKREATRSRESKLA